MSTVHTATSVEEIGTNYPITPEIHSVSVGTLSNRMGPQQFGMQGLDSESSTVLIVSGVTSNEIRTWDVPTPAQHISIPHNLLCLSSADNRK